MVAAAVLVAVSMTGTVFEAVVGHVGGGPVGGDGDADGIGPDRDGGRHGVGGGVDDRDGVRRPVGHVGGGPVGGDGDGDGSGPDRDGGCQPCRWRCRWRDVFEFVGHVGGGPVGGDGDADGKGSDPTGEPTTVLVAVSMTETVFEPELAT